MEKGFAKEEFVQMRMKVSNYIAEQLVAHGITRVFTVTGGGAMLRGLDRLLAELPKSRGE